MKKELKRDIIAGKYNGITAGVLPNTYCSALVLLNWDEYRVEGFYSYQSGGYNPEINKNEYTDNLFLFSVKMNYTHSGDPYFIRNGMRYKLDDFMIQVLDAGEYEDQHVKRQISFKNKGMK